MNIKSKYKYIVKIIAVSGFIAAITTILIGIFIYRPTMRNIAEQLCESKGMILKDFDFEVMHLLWVDCLESSSTSHTFEWPRARLI